MEKKNKYFLDVNVIQVLPPSNINRDDTGTPKTAQYGGVRRARVSSQCWKKAIRDYFRENMEGNNIGVRTLKLVDYVAEKIREKDSSISEEKSFKMAEKTLNDAGIKATNGKVKALFFLGNVQAENLAQASIDNETNKEVLQEILKNNPAVDIALFGRMLADVQELNEDASCQVAHAISTHAVETEFDYYTAIDELKHDTGGAEMLGTIEYNSSTLYRYANVAIHELKRQLGNKSETIKALKLFIEAFANSLPTGKINSFANTTLPSFILLTVRNDRHVNLVNAFEKPVRVEKCGFTEKSVERLLDEYKKSEKFVNKPEFTLYLSLNQIKNIDSEIIEKENLSELLSDFSEKLEKLME